MLPWRVVPWLPGPPCVALRLCVCRSLAAALNGRAFGGCYGSPRKWTVGRPKAMSHVAQALGERLAAHGLDITHPFDVRWYNDVIKEQQLPLVPLPSFGREDGQALGILVGNSAALWPPFLRWLGAQPYPDSILDPLDTFTRTIIDQELDVLVQQEMKKKGSGAAGRLQARCTLAHVHV